MVKKLLLPLSFILFAIYTVQAQNETLLTINGNPVTKDEFERIYHKNNNLENPSDPKNIQDYLTLFINFKLKVTEAQKMGLDTMQSFLDELKGYRDQLANVYIKDTITEDEFIRQEYERMKTEISIAHIFFKCFEDASPQDTLKAWQKAMQAEKRLNRGESFESVAKAMSEEIATKNDGGKIGYITAFSAIYPIENAIYKLKPGETSPIVRSSVGYHILHCIDRRPSRGEIKAAHIMKAIPRGSDKNQDAYQKAKTEIDVLYDSIAAGKDFSEMAHKYSDDKFSASNGGNLPWFSTGKMVKEIADAAFALKNNGDVSKPVSSPYGWHIIKRLDWRDIQPLSSLRDQIKRQIEAKGFSQYIQQESLDKLKQEYHFKEQPASLAPFFSLIDSSVLAKPGNLSIDSFKGLDQTMFTLGDKAYTQSDFANYILKKGPGKRKTTPFFFVASLYRDFANESVKDYANSHLEEKYPEFRYLMQEYHDGILLFDITDRMVWSKATKDTAGLEKFYEDHKNNYMWKERMSISVYSCKDTATALKTMKLASKRQKKNLPASWITSKICPEDSAKKCVIIEDLRVEKGDNRLVDQSGWTPGTTGPVRESGKIIFIIKNKVIPPEVKTLQEARGLVTADYQEVLEKQWVADLRARYTVSVNQSILNQVK